MLRWSVIFFVIALVAAFFGFTGIAEASTEIAKILFFVFSCPFYSGSGRRQSEKTQNLICLAEAV